MPSSPPRVRGSARTSRPSRLGEPDGRLDPAGERVAAERLEVAGLVDAGVVDRPGSAPDEAGVASAAASARSRVSPITRSGRTAAPNRRRRDLGDLRALLGRAVPSAGQGGRGADALQALRRCRPRGPGGTAARHRRPGGPGRCAARRARGTADPGPAATSCALVGPGQDQLQHHVVGEQDVRRVGDDRLAFLVASPGRCSA